MALTLAGSVSRVRQTEVLERCLGSLASPHFHHEFVKRAALMGAETANAQHRAAIGRLLASCSDAVTADQFIIGFRRALLDLPDLTLDSPAAAAGMKEVLAAAKQAQVFDVAAVAGELPVEVTELL